VDEKSLIDDLWPALEPPRDFSRRVVAAMDGLPSGIAPARRARLLPALAALSGAAVLALVLTFWLTRPRPSSLAAWGDVEAAARQTVHLAARGVAVAEPGAAFSWTSAAGKLRVDQRRGSVFYRVERGAPFVVRTPEGEVRVTGTCFQVIRDRHLEVHVFEGSVELTGSGGRLTLSAGDQARVEPGRTPVLVADDDGVPRGPDQPHRSHAARHEPGQAISASEPGGPPPGKSLDFTAAELRALGERCEFRYARPEHLVGFGPPDIGRQFDLDARERSAVLQIMEDQRTQYVEELRAIYIDIVGDRDTAAKLSPVALVDEITAKSRPGEDAEARDRLFAEWAGRAQAPTTLVGRPPVERFWRLVSSAPDTFIHRLSEVVGPDRARQIARASVHEAVHIKGPCGRFKR
jgi:hypothetical protein